MGAKGMAIPELFLLETGEHGFELHMGREPLLQRPQTAAPNEGKLTLFWRVNTGGTENSEEDSDQENLLNTFKP